MVCIHWRRFTSVMNTNSRSISNIFPSIGPVEIYTIIIRLFWQLLGWYSWPSADWLHQASKHDFLTGVCNGRNLEWCLVFSCGGVGNFKGSADTARGEVCRIKGMGRPPPIGRHAERRTPRQADHSQPRGLHRFPRFSQKNKNERQNYTVVAARGSLFGV